MPTATMLQTSGDVEYYTPPAIVEAARKTMYCIDLDPASSAKANEVVQASEYFTVDEDGLSQRWSGTVWLNHPFGRAEVACSAICEKEHEHHYFPYHGNRAWMNKLFWEWDGGNLCAACTITYASTSEKWFRRLLDYPQCFLTPRTNYLLPDGSVKRGVQKGSVVTYLGDEPERFARCFSHLGVVKVKL